jgi:hypothetical protein
MPITPSVQASGSISNDLTTTLVAIDPDHHLLSRLSGLLRKNCRPFLLFECGIVVPGHWKHTDLGSTDIRNEFEGISIEREVWFILRPFVSIVAPECFQRMDKVANPVLLFCVGSIAVDF